MALFPVTVAYRFQEGHQSRDAIFYGLFHDRSEEAVRKRLCEVHRFSDQVEIMDLRWRDRDNEQEPCDAEWQPRRHIRCRMFKPAHLVLTDAVLDCVLLDLSPGGAQVCLRTGAEVPTRAILRLPGGESRPMRRCWRRGLRIGFEAVGPGVLPS